MLGGNAQPVGVELYAMLRCVIIFKKIQKSRKNFVTSGSRCGIGVLNRIDPPESILTQGIDIPSHDIFLVNMIGTFNPSPHYVQDIKRVRKALIIYAVFRMLAKEREKGVELHSIAYRRVITIRECQ